MKNVTISMGDDTLTQVRIEAARAGQSVSRWIAARVAEAIDKRDMKAAASARIDAFLETFPGIPLSENGKITIDRDEIYGERFRRFDHDPIYAGPRRTEEAHHLRSVAEESSSGQRDGSEPTGS
jgi:hypothetical protein